MDLKFNHAAYVPLAKDQEKGKIREVFLVNQIQNIGSPIFYSQKGDFLLGEYLVEVGGKGKTAKQEQGVEKAFVLADDILVGSRSVIPLYLFGFPY